MLCLSKYLFIAFILVLISSCNGQTNAVHVNDRAGIGTPLVYNNNEAFVVQCGLIDTAGNLWIGTTGGKGIFVYNGNTFANYTVNEGLCSNDVYCLLQDRDNSIWIGTSMGVCKYDGKQFVRFNIPTDTIATYYFGTDTVSSATTSKAVVSILQDRQGGFWFGTLGCGVFRYNGIRFVNHLQFNGAIYNDGLHHNVVQDILEDRDGNFWFASMSHGGVSYFDDKLFKHFTYKDGLMDDMISVLFQDSKGSIWVGSRDNGMYIYNNDTFTHFDKLNGICNNITAIVEDSKGDIWMGSGRGGLFKYNANEFVSYTSVNGLLNSKVWMILEDNVGNIWVGTKGGNLYKYDGTKFDDCTTQMLGEDKLGGRK
jgi:ligand-binding sensor domain-containing protein